IFIQNKNRAHGQPVLVGDQGAQVV
ncbi:MAG: hypothetical protein UW02_C0019G0013, partial [Candidatus Nomurabacteria bacterium GW2011_GWB1_43_7]